ncbi:MAG TPA: hypothetical protein VFU36_12105, partial [Jatrophihabitans sp.]|nr:hypothetical protein [Jatrophihabitans sp.]
MGAAEDHEDLTRLVLILFRLRARAPLDEIQQLHTRFGWLAAFAGDPPHERATKQAVRDRLAAKLNDWLPDTATGLEAIGLTMRRPVRHLIRRRLTGQASLKEDAAGLQTSWDDEQARDTWSVNTVTGWLRDAADSIATALLRSAGQPAGIRPPRPSDPAPASWQDGIYDGLVRREPLLAEIDTWLTSGTANLAILRGRPGDGKSCLLITFLRELVANRAGTGITLVAAIQRENRNADPFRLDDLLAAIVQHRLARAQPGDDIPTQYGGITSQDRLRQAEQVVMSQPRDQPALIVVDAIDQLEDDRGTGSFVEGLGRLVRAADGTGYRFLLASRRSLPVDIGSARAHVIRLRADEDESDLRTALAAIVEPLNDTDRVRVVEGLQRRADGNWLWACLNARRIVAEAPTVGVPDPIEPREGLDGLWSDGVESIARRVGPEIYRRSVRSLLGWLAAAIDGRLGVNELRYVGKLTRDELADIAEASEPFIDVREDGTFALCHPDFSRWVLHPEHGAVAAESAHHTLAVGLTEMGIVTGWSPVTKPYAALHVLDHWHATFVLDPFPPDRPERVARLQQLITDPRWADRAGTVLVPILNTAELVPELRMPNSDLPVRDSIRQVMTLAWTITLVGMVIYEQMSAETAELADDMIARHSESQISSREAYMELLALVPNPAELVSRVIWGGLLDGLITVTASEDGGVDLMPSA